MVLLQREERLEEALAAVRQLKREFPKNPDYALEEAGILIARRDFPAARAAVRGFLGRRDSGFGNYQLAADGLAELRLGESFLFEKEWVSAEAAFERGLSASPVSEIEALLHFRRGNARDGMGRRSEGLRDYLRVRQIGSDEVLGEWAGQLLGTPWPEGAPEGGRAAMIRGGGRRTGCHLSGRHPSGCRPARCRPAGVARRSAPAAARGSGARYSAALKVKLASTVADSPTVTAMSISPSRSCQTPTV